MAWSVRFCIHCKKTKLDTSAKFFCCEEDCGFVLPVDNATPEKMSAYVEDMSFCYNCGEELKKKKKSLMCINGCGMRIALQTDGEKCNERNTKASVTPTSSATPSEPDQSTQSKKPAVTDASAPCDPGGGLLTEKVQDTGPPQQPDQQEQKEDGGRALTQGKQKTDITVADGEGQDSVPAASEESKTVTNPGDEHRAQVSVPQSAGGNDKPGAKDDAEKHLVRLETIAKQVIEKPPEESQNENSPVQVTGDPGDAPLMENAKKVQDTGSLQQQEQEEDGRAGNQLEMTEKLVTEKLQQENEASSESKGTKLPTETGPVHKNGLAGGDNGGHSAETKHDAENDLSNREPIPGSTTAQHEEAASPKTNESGSLHDALTQRKQKTDITVADGEGQDSVPAASGESKTVANPDEIGDEHRAQVGVLQSAGGNDKPGAKDDAEKKVPNDRTQEKRHGNASGEGNRGKKEKKKAEQKGRDQSPHHSDAEEKTPAVHVDKPKGPKELEDVVGDDGNRTKKLDPKLTSQHPLAKPRVSRAEGESCMHVKCTVYGNKHPQCRSPSEPTF